MEIAIQGIAQTKREELTLFQLKSAVTLGKIVRYHSDNLLLEEYTLITASPLNNNNNNNSNEGNQQQQQQQQKRKNYLYSIRQMCYGELKEVTEKLAAMSPSSTVLAVYQTAQQFMEEFQNISFE